MYQSDKMILFCVFLLSGVFPLKSFTPWLSLFWNSFHDLMALRGLCLRTFFALTDMFFQPIKLSCVSCHLLFSPPPKITLQRSVGSFHGCPCPFTHLIHRTRGVYSAHFAEFLIQLNDWSCRLQVGLDSASRKEMPGYWGQMTQGTQRTHELGQKHTWRFLTVS